MALVLLILCAKCYPLDLEHAWGEQNTFDVNADWQKENME
jgi:hypothetical protein